MCYKCISLYTKTSTHTHLHLVLRTWYLMFIPFWFVWFNCCTSRWLRNTVWFWRWIAAASLGFAEEVAGGGATVVDSLCSGSDVAAKMNFGFLPICFTPSFLHLLFCIIMRKNFFVRMQNHSKDWLGAACTLAGLVASISGCFFDVGVSENGVSEKGVYFPLTNSSSITSRECKLAFIPWQTLGDTLTCTYILRL